jgi:putative pyruvate formate lyase activating enzyme
MMQYPSYLEAFNNGTLAKKAEAAFRMLENCSICPRKCKANRTKGGKGFCRSGLKARVCSFMPHHGEEPPISGRCGSGTIFFSRCNMSCQYCQNFEFSQSDEGREVTCEELAAFMLELQKSGCHNINLVTPTHVMPQILQALLIATEAGLRIPLIYNTSGYELAEIIKLLDGIVDVYLTDMRYGNPEMGRKYSLSPDYPKYNQESVKEMHRQVGIADLDEEGIIRRGLIIRHLVLPNKISGTENIMKFIVKQLSIETYISLMSQYRPYYNANRFPELSRKISLEEYEEAEEIMHKYGLYNGWTQESFGLERFAGVHIKPILDKEYDS